MAGDPEDPRVAALEDAARRLFAGGAEFERGVVALDGLPADGLPEVAFAGRSNVGKSSLLNALLGRRDLARTSNTPGRTRELNLFLVGGRFRLVDMPGYGYARASRQLVRQWGALVETYLRGRPTLARVLLLVDARRGSLMPADEAVMALLDATAVSYQIVLTKADKIKGTARDPAGALTGTALDTIRTRVADAARRHPAAHPEILATSSVTKGGIAELRRAVFTAVFPDGL